jgi:hypothetical protein
MEGLMQGKKRSLVPQRLNRIDGCGPASRKESGEETNEGQE